jgi:hypothetical protein
MDAEADPYNLIKAEINDELQQMTSLQAKLFAGHGEVATVLGSRLQAAAEQLQALETAVQSMVAEPGKYGLTAAAAFGRQVSMCAPNTFAGGGFSPTHRESTARLDAAAAVAAAAAAALSAHQHQQQQLIQPTNTCSNASHPSNLQQQQQQQQAI